jgi:hypothetical protein
VPHPTQSDPHDLLRQAIAAYQAPGVTLTPDQVRVGADCLFEAIEPLIDVLRYGWGHITIYIGNGKKSKIEWLQRKMF